MARGRSPVLSNHTVQRWDLDKTYLITDTETWRGLLRIPFERGSDKRALPGVAALVKELRRSGEVRGATTSVNFVTASPPQIGRAIREKLSLDGIEVDEVRFKNQIHHLVRGHFNALREHVGFKLSELLLSARAGRREGVELLFGDDFESDPLIYSLYADVVEGRLSWEQLQGILDRVGGQPVRYLESIRESLEGEGPRRNVRAICILRARPREAHEFEPFGPRLVWFDSYLECAFFLHAFGDLDAIGVVEVATASEVEKETVAAAFEAAATRWPRLRREHFAVARRALIDAGLMDAEVRGGSLWRRALTRVRVATGRSPLRRSAQSPPLPDYDLLVSIWARRARKDREAKLSENEA